MNSLLSSRTLFFILLISSVIFILYQVRGILFPFIAAFIFSYFFNPLMSKITRYIKNQAIAASIIIAVILSLITIILIFIIPTIINQFEQIIKDFPNYKNYIETTIVPYILNYVNELDHSLVSKIESSLNEASSEIFSYITNIITSFLKSSLEIFNIISLVLITPIISFYILKDWSKITHTIKRYIPISSKTSILREIKKIDAILSAVIRGQVNVCMILAITYSVALYTIGIKYSFIIGISMGLLSFIPYLGFGIGAIISIFIAWMQYGNYSIITYLVIILAIIQIIESNFLTPKLIGDKIGLHPVWLLFFVLAGGSLFGFSGLLLAVPVGAMLSVPFTTIMKQYEHS